MERTRSTPPAGRGPGGGRRTHPTRRRFLAGIGAGSAAVVGLPGWVEAQEIPTVSMGDNYFDPVGLAVESGTTVRFAIESGSHSATAYSDRIPETARPFDSGTLSKGSFEHTFETAGTYDYYCRPHQAMGMVGRIVVDEPGGPAEAGPIPDGDVPDSDEIVQRGAVGIDDVDGGGRRSGMTGGGSGMMDDPGGWMMLMPVGFVTAFLGLVGATAYWAVGRAQSDGDASPRDGALRTLEERYARGEIGREEYDRRRGRLEADEQG